MFSSAKVDIVTDASGNATVYLTHGLNRKPNGFLVWLKYDPGTIDTGADITITAEDNGTPILAKTDAGTSPVFYYPRALANAVADGAAATNSSEYIPLENERIKIVVAQGGNAKTGSIKALILNDPAY